MIPVPSLADLARFLGYSIVGAAAVAALFIAGAWWQGTVTIRTVQEATYCGDILASAERTANATIAAQSTIAGMLGWTEGEGEEGPR